VPKPWSTDGVSDGSRSGESSPANRNHVDARRGDQADVAIDSVLEMAYEEAWTEWYTSDDASTWEAAAFDGQANAPS